MKNFLCLTGTLWVLCLTLSAQPPATDQIWLEKALQYTTDSPERVDLLLRLGNVLLKPSPKEALQYGEEAESLAQKLNNPTGQGKALALTGLAQLQLDRTRRGIRDLESAIPFLQASQQVEPLLSVYQGLSRAYTQLDRRSDANTYKQLAVALRQLEFNRHAALQIDSLSDRYAQEKASADAARAEANRSQATAKEVLETISEQEADLMRQEMELYRLEQQTAQLALEKAELERMNMENMLAIKQDEIEKNWLYGGMGFALLLALGIWQWFRFRQESKNADLERHKTQELQKIDRLKDQFLANTSHELRTPLNGIIGLAEALYQDAMPPAVQRENLSLIISAGKRLNKLVNNLLDFSKIQNERMEIDARPVDLRALVEVIVRIYQPLVQRKSLILANLVPADLPPVWADEERLQQILHNLIGNALKFTAQGTISVQAQVREGMIQVSVSDTGIGIATDKHEAIFQAFVQADGSIRREHTGTGLGLSISRELTELMGGKMWVKSTPETGSVFFFTLPISTEKVVQPPALDNTTLTRPVVREEALSGARDSLATHGVKIENPRPNQKPFHILVVDDEPINQEVLKHHLSGAQFEIAFAHFGQEALDMLESDTSYDLVLLDIMMPKMSGFEVCHEIRKKYSPSELPVIMVTAKNQVEDLVAGLDQGANDYIAKPFSRDELLARIQTHLNLYHLNEATMRFVPNEFLHSLGYDKITEVRLGDQVEQEVTVFFSDIRDYTTLSEEMSPEENFRFVNSYVGRMGPVIREYGGFVNQYLGDGIMALFMEGPEKAIRAGIKMQEVLTEYNETRIAAGRKPIRVGMGIHTGSLIMGVIGDILRNDPATISDTVNTASRMEGLTKFYGANLLISEVTLAKLDDPTQFYHRYLGKVKVKGKKIAIGVYEIIDADPSTNQTLKWGVQGQFEQGLRYYYDRAFAPAIEAFGQVLEINPEDKAALHYYQKATTFLQIGVPDNWSGVELMEHK